MHSPTLLILAAILMGIMTMMLMAAWRFNRQIAGFGFWATSYFFGTLFCVSLLVRTAVPEIWSVIATQSMLFLMAYLNLRGTRAYIGQPRLSPAYAAVALLLLIAVSGYFTMVHPDPGIRFTLSSLMAGVIFLLCARTIAKGKMQEYPARYLFAMACGGHGAFLLIRPWLFSLGNAGLFDAAQAIAVSQFVMVEAIAAIVLMAFGIVMLANEQVTLELRNIAERDPLTGVFNRRSFLTLLDKCISHSARMTSSLSIMLIDLDHFKRINDTWGHKSGDEALRHFVAVAAPCIRNGDIIGRIGGEEFAILLPNTSLTEAETVANRLRHEVAESPAEHEHGDITLTVSIGVTHYIKGEAPEVTLHRADNAMYMAKKDGRNQVKVALCQYNADKSDLSENSAEPDLQSEGHRVNSLKTSFSQSGS
ncbi:GGDEF domain-containing protein [Ferribacterium limneticum]|nr:GGDEF domain-containing protein [Ferribacterium limneticum]UCV31846.1 GGDEF domain-containing protein [Ferribacterium limneticum]